MAVVLSILKFFELPYGGSVTIASMLPVIIIAYRHGIAYGLISASVYGGIQQLLGLKNLSYFSTWQSVLTIILLDYIVAFAVIGLGGIFRNRFGGNQSLQLMAGSLLVCVLRYLCHVISGATVWAGLSIPTRGAIAYSLAYNATYMIPETIVLIAMANFIGSSLDFRFSTPVRVTRNHDNRVPVMNIIAVLLITAAAIFDVRMIFIHLQDGNSGNWDIGGLAKVNWLLVGIVTGIAVAAAAALIIAGIVMKKKSRESK